jgi:hypothetical protein
MHQQHRNVIYALPGARPFVFIQFQRASAGIRDLNTIKRIAPSSTAMLHKCNRSSVVLSAWASHIV